MYWLCLCPAVFKSKVNELREQRFREGRERERERGRPKCHVAINNLQHSSCTNTPKFNKKSNHRSRAGRGRTRTASRTHTAALLYRVVLVTFPSISVTSSYALGNVMSKKQNNLKTYTQDLLRSTSVYLTFYLYLFCVWKCFPISKIRHYIVYTLATRSLSPPIYLKLSHVKPRGVITEAKEGRSHEMSHTYSVLHNYICEVPRPFFGMLGHSTLLLGWCNICSPFPTSGNSPQKDTTLYRVV